MIRQALALALGWSLSSGALASEWRLLELESFAFEAGYLADNRDSYYLFNKKGYCSDPTGCEHWRGEVAVKWDLDLLKKGDDGLYWHNRVAGQGTDRQFRTVGWEYEAGFRWGRADFFHRHVSRHLLEDSRPGEKFPLHNVYMLRIRFYERSRSR